MKTVQELEKVLEESLHYFGLLRHAADSKNSADLADAGILLVEKTLRPQPIMEDVEEIVGWVNVYQRGDGSVYPGGIFPTERAANEHDNKCRISCQPIKVTVQREKKMPVERSVTVEAGLTEAGNLLCAGAFKKAKEFHGKYGELTFTIREYPTT